MKILILAGGYGKRLSPLTQFRAKPLLPIGGKPLLNYILEKLPPLPLILSTNLKYFKDFQEWMRKERVGGKILVEETRREEEKPGSVGGLIFALEKEKIEEPLLVVAGDNLFDFSLSDFIKHFKNEVLVALYDMEDKEKIKGKLGNVLVDKEGKILKFIEKPSHPISTLVSTGCYIFPPFSFSLLKTFYQQADRERRDKMGYLLKWLVEEEKVEVRGFTFQGLWIDIGGRESYLEANLILSGRDFYCEEDTEIVNSSLHHSVVLKGSKVINSNLRGCIVDEKSWIEGVDLEDTIIGQGTILKRVRDSGKGKR